MMSGSAKSGVGGGAGLRSLLRYHAVSRLQTAAASDVGRGSETLMTFVRGDLFRAARMFAARRSRALVVTGFFIPKAAAPAAESDGPVGAVELCAALRAIGGEAWLVSDSWCRPVVQAGARGSLPEDHVLIAPDGSGFDSWFQEMHAFVRDNSVDTVIFIERVGPSRDGSPRNMRGLDILEWTAPLSRLSRLGLHTVGIGDGGNEIGMGRIAPYAIEGVVRHGEKIACTVATQELIVSGTSNWGGHALVCALYALGCRQTEPFLEESWHRDVLARIARAGGLDGVTLRNTPTVDGLSEEAYFSRIRALSHLATL